MITGFMRGHPFWSYYILAISIFAALIVYMVGLEVWGQMREGPDYSLLSDFRALQRELTARHPVLFHHQDSWVFYLSCYLVTPIALPFFFLPFAPTVSAVLHTAVRRGKAGLGALLALYLPVRGNLSWRDGLRIYLTLLACLISMVLMVCLAELFFGEPQRLPRYTEVLGLADWQTFLGAWIMALFFNQGAALEELGWRGYALPMLIRKLGSPLSATVMLGALWALWHFPREVPPLLLGEQSPAELLNAQFFFFLSCISMSIVAAFFVNIAGGSVLPAIMIHGTLNHVGSMFSTGHEGMRVEIAFQGPLMWLAFALVVLLVAGPDLGWKRRQELHQGSDPSETWFDERERL